jgi:chloramphenicol O-acetyltransferase type A
VIPWVAFTSFAHARRHGTEDSVPKIVFGKRHERGGRHRMPVSVEVHHALVDGLHVGRFFEGFQERLDRGECFSLRR